MLWQHFQEHVKSKNAIEVLGRPQPQVLEPPKRFGALYGQI
jgi:hypothetical protein